MITLPAISTVTDLSNTQKSVSNSNHDIAQKVGKAWQAKSIPSTKIINKSIPNNSLTEIELTEVNKLLTQLKVNDSNGDTSSENHRDNFLIIYKKLINISKKEQIAFITNVQKVLNIPNSYDNQELLSNTFKRAIYRYNAIALMNQPLVNQMNDQINSISLEGNDEEEEYKFY